MNLTRVRVAPREATVRPVATTFPPVPTRPGQAEPYRPAPDPSPTTTAHRAPRFRAPRLRDRTRRLAGRFARWREREAWAAGFAGGRTVERAEIADHIRAELVRGAYDYRTSADAVREILRYLAEEER